MARGTSAPEREIDPADATTKLDTTRVAIENELAVNRSDLAQEETDALQHTQDAIEVERAQ